MPRTLIGDVETDGLLDKLTRVHCLVLKDPGTHETFRFRRRDAGTIKFVGRNEAGDPVINEGTFDAEDNIADGLAMLESADTIVGHNFQAFDLLALQKVYPEFRPRGVVRDTLVIARILQPDTKEGDFRLWNKGRGVLPGYLIGSHSLAAWGYRMGLHKGDYAKLMEKVGLDPWAYWNPPQEDYCANDTDVTEAMWHAITHDAPPDISVQAEHDIHDLCAQMERNGFPFDLEAALNLRDHLRSEYEKVSQAVKDRYGYWFAPERKHRIRPEWVRLDEVKESQRAKYKEPRPEFGEDDSRAWWGDVTVPARAMKFKSNVPAHLCAPGATHSYRSPDAPYCKIKRKEFNPGSRQDVIDRFTQLHKWVPTDFSEDTGTPEVNDGILQGLKDKIPEAETVAECFFLQKMLGQIAEGQQAWIKKYNHETRAIHGRINVGGTVSGRGAHSDPNLGQVKAVLEADVKLKDGSFNPKILGLDGAPIAACFKNGVLREKIPLKGRDGEFGWECRALFGVHVRNKFEAEIRGLNHAELEASPDGWTQVGVDLKSIEFRGLAEVCAPFDNGELMQVVLGGTDIHSYNAKKAGIPRATAKTLIYALMYGAGDWKLGVTVNPALASNEAAAKKLGAELRAMLMAGLPALKAAIDKVQWEAQRGYLTGLDGRRLHCRSPHSALNLRIQSDCALIAKRWCVLTDWYAQGAGMKHSWFDDYAMLTWVHDEIQTAVRRDCREEYAELCKKAAADAGLDYGWRCPVEADAKFGMNWAQTH